jgi:peptidoglycan/LPS O-acetylase OafA/YrhL
MSVESARPPLVALTSLRFFAAAAVVIFHADLPWQIGFIKGLTLAGYQAVTFFFVLSGFILTYVYSTDSAHQKRSISALAFWQARFARIGPGYFCSLLVALPPFAYTAFISHQIARSTFILGLTLVPTFQQAWWPAAALLWNVPAWSLSVEFFFYLLFPFLDDIMSKAAAHHLLAAAYLLIVATTALKFCIAFPALRFAIIDLYATSNQLPDPVTSNFALFFPLFHLPQFIFGMALGRYFLFELDRSVKISGAIFWIGILSLIVILGERAYLPWWLQTDAALVLSYGMIIIGGTTIGTGSLLVNPLVVLLGEASYGVYIFHSPLRFWWEWMTIRVAHLDFGVFADFFAYLLFVNLIASLFYLYLEKPARRYLLGHESHRTV